MSLDTYVCRHFGRPDPFLSVKTGQSNREPEKQRLHEKCGLVTRVASADTFNKSIHFTPVDVQLPLRGLSGIAFLLMVFPALSAALALTASNSTVYIRGDHYERFDAMLKDPKLRGHLWINRRNALTSRAGWLVSFTAKCPALSRAQVEQWMKGEFAPLVSITPRGIIEGVQKCHGLLGFSLAPQVDQFRLYLALPV